MSVVPINETKKLTKSERRARKQKRRANAGLLGWLCRDIMQILSKNVKLRDVLRMLQTCHWVHLNPVLRFVVHNVKPGMIKAINAHKQIRGGNRRLPLSMKNKDWNKRRPVRRNH